MNEWPLSPQPKRPFRGRRPGRRRPSGSTSTDSGRGSSGSGACGATRSRCSSASSSSCSCSPAWRRRSGPTRSPTPTSTTNHLTDTIKVDGKTKNVVGLDGVPIGPQWLKADGKFFLGADRNGRDIMVRLLYGGRNSLVIGVVAALITTILSIVLGVVAGLLPRRRPTRSSARLLDVALVVPGDLLGVALGVALALGGLKIGPITSAGRLAADTDRHHRGRLHPVHGETVRGQVLSLREKEFVEAARAQGAGPLRIMFTEIAAEPRLDDHRLLHAADRQRDPARGGAVVPRRGRAAAEPVLGHDDRRGRRPDRDRAAPDDRARASCSC